MKTVRIKAVILSEDRGLKIGDEITLQCKYMGHYNSLVINEN